MNCFAFVAAAAVVVVVVVVVTFSAHNRENLFKRVLLYYRLPHANQLSIDF